jgi:hypothetical protein
MEYYFLNDKHSAFNLQVSFFIKQIITWKFMTTETMIESHNAEQVLFSICHPVKIMTDQKTDHTTHCSADYNGGNSACGEITNTQSKDHKKYNEYPGTTFAFDF